MPKSVAGVMHEWKHGQLHSGSSRGPIVHNPKQAIAIALSEQREQEKTKKQHNPREEHAEHGKKRALYDKTLHGHLTGMLEDGLTQTGKHG